MTVPKAQSDPYLRRFPLRRVAVQTAGATLRLLAPRSARALLAAGGSVARCASRGAMPHWADVWPASVAIARHLLRGPSLAGCHAVDLGCGVGLAGTAAGLRGARVSFADREVDALHFARFNAAHNGVAEHAAIRLDWARDPVPADCDLLLLADVAYEYRHLRSLLRQVRSVVGRGGRALCADPYRPSAHDLFAWLRREFAVELVDLRVHLDGAGVAVRLASISPPRP